MKVFLQAAFFVFVLLAGSSFAQKNFQGTITYDVKITGENANMYAGMMPNKYVFKIRNSEMRMRMEGGMMAGMFGDVLVDQSGSVFLINENKQSAQKVVNQANQKKEELNDTAIKVTKLGEVVTIAGKKCQKYKVEINNSEKTKEVEWIWSCADMQITSSDKDAMMVPKLARKGIDGFPLKIMTTKEGMTMTMTATSVVDEKLNDDIFKVPSGFKISEFDPSKMLEGFGSE